MPSQLVPCWELAPGILLLRCCCTAVVGDGVAFIAVACYSYCCCLLYARLQGNGEIYSARILAHENLLIHIFALRRQAVSSSKFGISRYTVLLLQCTLLLVLLLLLLL